MTLDVLNPMSLPFSVLVYFSLFFFSYLHKVLIEVNKRAIIAYRDYYACDAGCLDPPVQLGLQPVKFPVKLTEPLTAILYITGRMFLLFMTNIIKW